MNLHDTSGFDEGLHAETSVVYTVRTILQYAAMVRIARLKKNKLVGFSKRRNFRLGLTSVGKQHPQKSNPRKFVHTKN